MKDINFIYNWLRKMRIRKRIVKSDMLVAYILNVSVIIGVISLLLNSNSYSKALTNYGFSQGDIGKTAVVFADIRSSTRAIVGYEGEDALNKARQTHDDKKEAFLEYLDVMGDTLNKEEHVFYDDIVAALTEYWKIDDEIIELGSRSDDASYKKAQSLAENELDTLYEGIYENFKDLMSIKVEEGDRLEARLFSKMIIIIVIMVGTSLSGFLIANKIGKRLSKGITEPLDALAERLKTFAEGDLSSEFPAMDHNDEVTEMVETASGMAENLTIIIEDAKMRLNAMAAGDFTCESKHPEKYVGEFEELHNAIHDMSVRMNETLHRIEEASKQVAAGASNLADGSQTLAEGSTEQASTVEELLASFADITSSVDKTSESMNRASEVSEECARGANESWEQMQKMVEAMNTINDTAKKIESIIADIEEIASQTNLLSLNASIEAARAGEAGRGFAVVATQIGKLAEESAQSAINTRELITGAISEVERGNNAASVTSEKIQNVVKGINELEKEVNVLSEMASRQAQQMEQAEQAVNQISEVIQSNAAIAEESSATSQELSAESASLDGLVQQFTLNK